MDPETLRLMIERIVERYEPAARSSTSARLAPTKTPSEIYGKVLDEFVNEHTGAKTRTDPEVRRSYYHPPKNRIVLSEDATKDTRAHEAMHAFQYRKAGKDSDFGPEKWSRAEDAPEFYQSLRDRYDAGDPGLPPDRLDREAWAMANEQYLLHGRHEEYNPPMDSAMAAWGVPKEDVERVRLAARDLDSDDLLKLLLSPPR